jgi:hypothetical protein
MSLGVEELDWRTEASELLSADQWSWKSGCEEDFVCAVVQWYLEFVIQWNCYSNCVKIRCQETASGEYNTLRTLVYVCV